MSRRAGEEARRIPRDERSDIQAAQDGNEATVVMQATNKMLSSLPCLEEGLTKVLNVREKTVLPPDGMVEAAVLIALFLKEGRTHVLLTKRSDQVEHHRGEISFPGGKLDPEDEDLLSCALREADEEVGISPAMCAS